MSYGGYGGHQQQPYGGGYGGAPQGGYGPPPGAPPAGGYGGGAPHGTFSTTKLSNLCDLVTYVIAHQEDTDKYLGIMAQEALRLLQQVDLLQALIPNCGIGLPR